MLLGPRQQVTFNVAVTDVVKDLVSRTEIAVWNTEKVFHIVDLKVGHAPGANLPRRTQAFEGRHNAGEVGNSSWPVQQIEVEMISTKTSEASLASTRHAASRGMPRQHLAHEES